MRLQIEPFLSDNLRHNEKWNYQKYKTLLYAGGVGGNNKSFTN
jgi:hypothetical protein